MTTKEACREAHMRASIMLQTAIAGWHWKYPEEDAVKIVERLGKKGAA